VMTLGGHRRLCARTRATRVETSPRSAAADVKMSSIAGPSRCEPSYAVDDSNGAHQHPGRAEVAG
jgi:hypothetical protein